jgi:hypothetical protein
MDLTTEQRGRRAKEILEDEVFTSVVSGVREQIVAQWHLTKLNDKGMREDLFMQSRGLDEVVRGLRTHVANWTMEKTRTSKKRRK